MRHLTLLSAGAIAAGLTISPAAADMTLIYGDTGNNRGPSAASKNWFFEQMAEQLDIAVDAQWGGALFGADASINAISSGVVDVGYVLGSYFPSELAPMHVAELPLGNADTWVGLRATHDLIRNSPEIQAHFADLGVVFLAPLTATAVNVGCKDTEIRSVEDFEGVRVRAFGTYGRALTDLGANNVSLNVYEAYQAMDTGLIDCTLGYTFVARAFNWHEQMTSYTLLDWGQPGAQGLFMNLSVFEGLPEETQNGLLALGEQFVDVFAQNLETYETGAFELMDESGVEVITLGDDDRANLQVAAEAYVGEWVEGANNAGFDGEQLLATYRELIAQYEAERDELGYPWLR